jgi:ATP-dependent helicase HrpA
MEEKDILLRTPANKELADYPTSLNIGSTAIALSYRFEPVDERDGVTAYIPEYLLDSLKPEYFEWLVPGLLVEKTTFLIKGLPKKIRKHLIPINTTVERILDSLVLYRGNYLASLSETLFKMFKLTIHAGDWPKNLPRHLQMRFVVKDSAGNELTSGRDFSKLQTEFLSSSQKKSRLQVHKKDQELIDHYKNSIFTDWDFADVPRHIPLYGDKNDVLGYLFPALRVHPQKTGVTVSFEKTKKKARRVNRAGTHHLLLLQFKEQFKRLKKYCLVTLSGPSTIWLTSLLGKRETVAELLLERIIGELFEADFEPIIEKRHYNQIISQVTHQGLFKRGTIIIDKIMNILRQRKNLYETINRYSQLADKSGNKNQALYSDLHKQLNEIIPGDFLEKYTIDELDCIPRYLKSLEIRTERSYANPHKDQQKQAKILPHQRNIETLRKLSVDATEDCKEMFKNYERAVAEYRISLFSPEIKTTIGVSEKKIITLWQHIQRSC